MDVKSVPLSRVVNKRFFLLVEHSFFLAFAIGNAPMSYTWIDALNRYLETNFSYVFLYIRYNIFLGLLMQVKYPLCSVSSPNYL